MQILLYDTTLRDGTQREGLSLSVEDKLKIARELDLLGVHYIEGGWPGSNPKDAEFFQRIRRVTLRHAKSLPLAAPATLTPPVTPTLTFRRWSKPIPCRHAGRQKLDAPRREGARNHAPGKPSNDRR